MCRFAPILAPSLAALLTLGTAPALADEVWTSNVGPVMWETDLGETAVLRLDVAGTGALVRMFVPGLATDMMGGRGAYTGVWVASDADEECVVEMVDPVSARKSRYWGTFTITFVNEGFPSDWAGVYGNCLQTPAEPIQAHAQVGGQ